MQLISSTVVTERKIMTNKDCSKKQESERERKKRESMRLNSKGKGLKGNLRYSRVSYWFNVFA